MEETLHEKAKFRILSIDGGGIRGYIPALILQEIENELNRIPQPNGAPLKLHEFFDLVVGTSTGGILALGLAKGLEGSHLVDVYSN